MLPGRKKLPFSTTFTGIHGICCDIDYFEESLAVASRGLRGISRGCSRFYHVLLIGILESYEMSYSIQVFVLKVS